LIDRKSDEAECQMRKHFSGTWDSDMPGTEFIVQASIDVRWLFFL
jgi:hypothetical protein